MRIVFVSAAWRRFDVTRLALAQRAHLCGVLAGRGHEATGVVVADDDNIDIAREYGFDTVEQSNESVGRKFNDGFEHAFRRLGADVVVHVGSDDWVHEDVFDVLPCDVAPAREPTWETPVVTWGDGPQIVAGTEMTLVDLVGGTLRRVRHPGRHGVIPWLIPRAAMGPSGFRPVHERANTGIDFSLVSGLGMQCEWVFHDPAVMDSRVDWKSGESMNSYAKIAGAIGYGDQQDDPWQVLADRYPADLVGLARDTHERLRGRAVAA